MLITASSTDGVYGVVQILITNFMPILLFICALLFFAMIVGILLKMAGQKEVIDFEVDNDELFSDEI